MGTLTRKQISYTHDLLGANPDDYASEPQDQCVDPDTVDTAQSTSADATVADSAQPNQSVGADASAVVARQSDQTGADQPNATVILAAASIPPLGGPDPCLDILEQIIALLDELAKRINDALDDPHDLFNKFRKVKDAHPQYGSWDGHEDRFKYDRDRLRQKIGEWEANDNCRGRRLSKQQQDELDEAYEYKEKEYPAKPAKSHSQQADPEPAVQPEGLTAEKVLKVLLVLGLAIALVPTVVAALADPEPASKLALAGLTLVEITALAAALGFSAPKPPDGA